MPGAVAGRRATRLIRFCHLGDYILLEETDHQARNEITLVCGRECPERRWGALIYQGVTSDGTDKKGVSEEAVMETRGEEQGEMC